LIFHAAKSDKGEIPCSISSTTSIGDLDALQRDGRLQNLELARLVGLSPSACLRRVRLLEEGGYIDRYVALLNEAKVGRGFTVFVRVWLRGQDEDTTNHFINSIKSFPEVLECHLMAGDCDFLLRVAVADLDAYRQFQMQHLNRIAGVQNTKTEIPMQRISRRPSCRCEGRGFRPGCARHPQVVPAAGRQPQQATAEATACIPLDGGVGPVAGDAVNPSMGAWPRHPCRGRPCQTHPAFDSSPQSAGTA
jgi:DNA-binding Lrp family transcriptional regulator